MKKILILSILVSFFASCGHMGGHKHHNHSGCSVCEKTPCKGECTADSTKAEVKKECEECKKAT